MQLGGDSKTQDNIAKFGCSVIHVMEEGDLPPLAYSIGITQQTGAPEVVVIGLKQPIAHFIINEYNKRMIAGVRLERGTKESGFLEGFDVLVETVPLAAYDEYFGQAIDFYGGPTFTVIQLVYPTTQGLWPWDDGVSESFRLRQPILANTRRH